MVCSTLSSKVSCFKVLADDHSGLKIGPCIICFRWAEATKESFQDLRLSSKPLETTGIRGSLAFKTHVGQGQAER